MVSRVEKNLSDIKASINILNETNQTVYDNMDLQYKWAYTYLTSLK